MREARRAARVATGPARLVGQRARQVWPAARGCVADPAAGDEAQRGAHRRRDGHRRGRRRAEAQADHVQHLPQGAPPPHSASCWCWQHYPYPMLRVAPVRSGVAAGLAAWPGRLHRSLRRCAGPRQRSHNRRGRTAAGACSMRGRTPGRARAPCWRRGQDPAAHRPGHGDARVRAHRGGRAGAVAPGSRPWRV